jgi:hypothetical protein
MVVEQKFMAKPFFGTALREYYFDNPKIRVATPGISFFMTKRLDARGSADEMAGQQPGKRISRGLLS